MAFTGHDSQQGIIRGTRKTQQQADLGFTMVELSIVVLIVLTLSGIAVPRFVTMLHASKLSGATTDFASVLQTQRLRAVADNRYYSTYLLAATGASPQMAFVDIYPQQANGTSGTNGTSYTSGDPLITIASEVTPQAQGNAPNTTNLKQQLLPSTSPVIPQDGSINPITFGARGLPCVPSGGVCNPSSGVTGGTAYWVFFQNNVTQNWSAVTVSPAGRIRRWTFGGGANGAWSSY